MRTNRENAISLVIHVSIMKPIHVLSVLALGCLLSCNAKKEAGTESDGEGSAAADAGIAHLSGDFRIPSKPWFPGIKRIPELDRVTTDKRGEKVLMRLAFDRKSSDNVKWSMPIVRQGWIRIQTDDGVIRIFPQRRIEIRRDGGGLDASGVPGWMIDFSIDCRCIAGSTPAPGLSVVNLADPEAIPDFQQLGFRLPMKVEGGVSYLVVAVEFSNDYKGDGGYWYVMQGV